MSPEGKKDKTIETLKRIVLKGSEIRPLVMAIEDLHWIDKTSEDVLKYLLESIAGARVLLILTYRPEFIPTWGARSYHNQLLLNRPSNRESLFMATHILGREQIPPIPPLLKGGGGDFCDTLGAVNLETALEEVIPEKTEGIPFFIEEFIKSLKDLGFIERKDATYRIAKSLQTVHIPSTIQDIILARVDALPEGAKELLQVGSLIEREFSYKLIKAAMHLPEEELFRRLSFLKDAELLYERGLFPDSTFVFKHALTREVVYGTLLERRKKELHIDIGRAIEEVDKDNLEEMYSSLAEHFEQGGDFEKAATYLNLAQRRARRKSAILDAITYSKREVTCLEKLVQTVEQQKQIIDARIALANNCRELSHHREAMEAVAPILDLAQKLDYRKNLAWIYVGMATYLILVEERHIEAETRWYLKEAQRLALEEKDFQSLSISYHYEGWLHGLNSEFAEGESCFLRVIEMNNEVRGFMPIWPKILLAQNIYAHNGRIKKALRCSQEALQLALQADDLYAKGGAYVACGSAFLRKGLFPEAEENLILAAEINQKTDFAGWLLQSYIFLGLIRHETGRYQEAKECYNAFLGAHERLKLLPSYARYVHLLKAAAGVRRGLNPSLNSVLNFDLQEMKIKWLQGMAAHCMGEIYFYIDDDHMDKAEVWIKKAIEADEHNKMPWDLARDYALYAEFFKKKGDSAQAKEKLGIAIELMRSIGADGWVKRYEEGLGALL
jgi:predicted ATPase